MEDAYYLESSEEFPPDAAREELHDLLVVHVEQLVQVHTPVGELPEGPLLVHLSSSFVSHGRFFSF